MKKLIAVLMIMAMLTGAAACGKDSKKDDETEAPETTETEAAPDIEELKTINGPMLEITSTIMADVPEDYDIHNTVTINYDGQIFIPHNPITESGIPISDEDYMTVYEFCIESVENDTFADYHEDDICDGTTYRFVFYDDSGEAHEIYDGYMYANEELRAILSIVGNYEMD